MRARQSVLIIDTPLPTWTTIFSSMFIHGGLFHFAGNMMFLWVFGDNVEDWLGHYKYLIFYVLVGIAATLSQLAIDPRSLAPMIGASGAISGVMGAYMLLYPFNRINTLIIFYFITVIRLPAGWLLGLWFLWQAVQGFGSLAISSQVSVAFFAHVGGFVAGVILVAVFKLLTGPADLAVAPAASTVGLLVPDEARTGLIFFSAGRVTPLNPARRSPFLHHLYVGPSVAP